ncbi:MAG: hypothetical protein HFJ04_05435 [Lachnospiraceae bacterium]|nr:hypothetical protein [Lachnospiraceae bacterium]
MQENYISKNIRSLYRRRLLAPVLYLIFVASLCGFLPISSVIAPTKLSGNSDLETLYQKKEVFVSGSFDNLKFTGYTMTRFHRTVGYFYYIRNPNEKTCSILLLSPNTCEQGIPELTHVDIYGKIISADASYQTLLTNLSDDLSWTDDGIRAKTDTYYLSEPDFQYGFGIFLLAALAGSSVIALLSILLSVLYILKPHLSPPCQTLIHFGKPKKLLASAEQELATLPQLATEDMFITEHFFIETSRYGTAIVPIQEIIWIYKHSTLHKLFWYHFSITYTLHIVANKHVSIRCPKNMKSDIDGIMDYLAEANHAILVGFSEENRRKAGAVQRQFRNRRKQNDGGASDEP